MTQPAMPHIRSALLIATTAMEESESACKVVEDDTEHKDKTFEDTELLLSIGKAIGKLFVNSSGFFLKHIA